MVSLCEEESKRASFASSAEEGPIVPNKRIKKWKLYTEKGLELTMKVQSVAIAPMPALQVASYLAKLVFLGPHPQHIRMGLCLQGRYEDAEKYLTAALGEAIKGFGIDDHFTAVARMQLAEHYA